LTRPRLRFARLGLVLLCVALLVSACNAPLPGQATPGVPAATRAPETAVPATLTALAPTPLTPGDGAPGGTPSGGAPSATPAGPTPSDTGRPTQTPLPAVALTSAQRAMLNGNYPAAIAEYQAVLAQSASGPDLQAEAQYGLGEALLREGFFAESADALHAFLERYPDDPRAVDAHFLLGEALRSDEQWAAAVDAYETYLAADGPGPSGAIPAMLAPYVYDRIGDSHIAGGEYVAAIEDYRAALDAAPLDVALAVREKLAQAHLSLNDYAAAVGEYDAAISAVSRDDLAARYNYYLKAKYLYLAGSALLAAGDTAGAYARFQEAVDGYPQAYDAYGSLVVLVEAGVPVDDLQRGVVDYYAGAYDAAIQALHRYENDNTVHNGDAHYFVAMSYVGLGNYEAAVTEFTLLIDTHPEATRWGEAWLERARALASTGDVSAALDGYAGLAGQAPDHPLAGEALWRGLLLAERNQDWGGARRLGAQMAGYPGHDRAPEGVLRAGLAAYRAGDLAAARGYWELVASDFASTPFSAGALLWLAKTSDDPAQRADLLARARRSHPNSLYALRAADLAEGRDPFQRPSRAVQLDFDEAAERAQAEDWLADRLGVANDGALGTLSSQLAADERLQRGGALWRFGLYPEAKVELESLRAAHAEDLLASYQLALYFRDLGNYRSSILAARAVLNNAGMLQSPSRVDLSGPRYFAYLAYPTYYADLILPEAERRGMDPLVMFSLIMQESVFEGLARSSSGAQGLMQIIPPTGEAIADALDWPDYRNELLYRPYVNVPFGVFYVAEQRDRFNGSIFAALAAYNAGPGNSSRWYSATSGDPDLFYETITLGEPRLYIQRIYERWQVFRDLYAVDQ
jgi:soluble lytic murein transglycosylase